MKFEKDTSGFRQARPTRIKRYVAFDIHKEYALVGGQNAQQEWGMAQLRIGMEKLREWVAANLRKGDAAGKFKDVGYGWYQLTLSPSNFRYINLGGVTQFRLRFTEDDDNDKKADFISFFSGDDVINPPRLIMEYAVSSARLK